MKQSHTHVVTEAGSGKILMKKAKKIRDPVHGDIHLGKSELTVLDTTAMQRLRGIRQLGATFYVYPGAQHSRFEHSLGTYCMAQRIMESIEDRGEFGFSSQEKDTVKIASLLHDITHIPYGHTFEDERKLMARHDENRHRFDYFLGGGEIGDALSSSKAGRLARQILDPGGSPPKNQSYLQDIVSGTICADLLDYLKRDNYFCGLTQEYDQRIFHYLTIKDGNLTLKLHQNGIFRPDALSEITNLLRIRYVLSERVYYHHAKIACGTIISKTIERALRNGMEESELYDLTDNALPGYLLGNYGGDPAIRELIDTFRSRRLYKRVYMLSRKIGAEAVNRLVENHHLSEEGQRAEAESAIAAGIGVQPHQIAIYCPPEKMSLKEADMPCVTPKGDLQKFSALNQTEISTLQEQHRRLWKFYVFASPAVKLPLHKIASACEEMFGLPNELPKQNFGE